MRLDTCADGPPTLGLLNGAATVRVNLCRSYTVGACQSRGHLLCLQCACAVIVPVPCLSSPELPEV
eukprot:11647431-Alexandrium_andersonii.AAC.1